MPGMTAAEWGRVSGDAGLQRLTAAHGVLASLSFISRALRTQALLDDDNVLDAARRLGLDVGVLEGWAVVGGVHDRNNRYEIDLLRSFRMAAGNHPGYVPKVVHCSKRHNKDDYWIAYDDAVFGGGVLNTIAYCSTTDFKKGFLTFAGKIVDALNVWEGRRRLHPADPKPRADALAPYVPPAGQPKFASDSGASHSIHAYCVVTAGAAITLDNATHTDLKIVLRGVYGPPATKAAASAAWLRIRDRADVQEVIPVHERAGFERELGL